jgi:hypothetical protein
MLLKMKGLGQHHALQTKGCVQQRAREVQTGCRDDKNREMREMRETERGAGRGRDDKKQMREMRETERVQTGAEERKQRDER